MSHYLRSASIILAILLAAGCVFGQNIYSSITGRVTDPADAVVSEARITVINVDTGNTRTAVTDSRGEYLIQQLPLGSYRMVLEADGFKQEIRRDVTLLVDQKSRQDFQLQLGAITEQVSVSAAVPLLETDSATVAQTITNQQVTELPLNGRDFNQLPMLAPSVVQAPSVGNAGSGYSVAGARSTSNSFSIDGGDMIDSGPTRLYAFAKSLDVSSNSTGPAPMYSYNLKLDYGLSNFDLRHRLTSSFTYELPIGKGRMWGAGWNRILDGILGGWQSSGILTAQSGFALTPVLSGDISATGGNVDRPNLLSDPFLAGAVAGNASCSAPGTVQTARNWVNPCAFSIPAAGTFGMAARGSLSGPGLFNLDISAQKYIRLSIDMMPTWTVLRKGTRIRIAITTSEGRINYLQTKPVPTISILRDSLHVSYLSLPVVVKARVDHAK